ncbi:FecR family protein [Treponema primitia]|uniref:FecR family protein n=1 Tax=Treponema primitia TaxID=88058 RepID=UPI0002555693|nr:FecR family protein [Treponema primitia]
MKNALLAVILCFCFSLSLVSAQETTATIQELKGTVEVKASGTADWTAARQGMRLAKAASISTGIKSTAVIALGNSIITVRPLTRLSLEELTRNQDAEKVDIYIQSGRIRTEVSPPSGGKIDFTVRSPMATASVRGTTFDFDGENLSVTSGRVNLSGSDGVPTVVRAGESSYVSGRFGRAVNTARVTITRPAAASPAPAGTDSTTVSGPPVGTSPPPTNGSLGIGLDWYRPNGK